MITNLTKFPSRHVTIPAVFRLPLAARPESGAQFQAFRPRNSHIGLRARPPLRPKPAARQNFGPIRTYFTPLSHPDKTPTDADFERRLPGFDLPRGAFPPASHRRKKPHRTNTFRQLEKSETKKPRPNFRGVAHRTRRAAAATGMETDCARNCEGGWISAAIGRPAQSPTRAIRPCAKSPHRLTLRQTRLSACA